LPLRRFDISAGWSPMLFVRSKPLAEQRVRIDFDRAVLYAFRSPGAAGLMSDAEALTHLLSESGILHRFTGRRTAVLTLQTMTDTIDVSAPAPEIASPKFTQPLLDTPRTVAVIADEVFLAQGATTLRDLLRNTPGTGGGRAIATAALFRTEKTNARTRGATTDHSCSMVSSGWTASSSVSPATSPIAGPC
jgi:catecholate siderophore receptor